MSDVLIASIITFTGTVILAPIVVRLLSLLSEKRSQLLVLLTWNEAQGSAVLEERVAGLIRNSEAFKATSFDNDAKYAELNILRGYLSAKSYLRFKIHNNSKKKLSHLTVQDDGSSTVYMVGDQPLKQIGSGKPIELGDLQPGRDVELHLWSSWSVPVWHDEKATKKRFRFSADELDRVIIKEPLHEFLRQRFKYRLFKFCLFVMVVMWVVVIGYSAFINK